MRASRVDTFWKNETREPDDRQEFQGLMKLIDALNLDLEQKSQNNLPSADISIVKWLRNNLTKIDKNITEKNPKVIGSPTTPYILCFSTALNDPNLLCRFCSKKNGSFEVGILLDYDALCNEDSILAIKYENEPKRSYDEAPLCKHSVEKELMHVYYANREDELLNSNAKYLHCCAIEELKAIDESRKKNTEVSNGSRNTDGDYDIDACFFVKRGKYACEEEIRMLLQVPRPSAFYIDKTAKNIAFATETIVKENLITYDDLINNTKNVNESYIFVNYKINIVKGIVFGPCVSKEKAQDYANKFHSRRILDQDKPHKIMFLLSDGTEISPEQ